MTALAKLRPDQEIAVLSVRLIEAGREAARRRLRAILHDRALDLARDHLAAAAARVRATGPVRHLARPPAPPAAVVPRVRELSIRAALEWAFGVEREHLDLDGVPEWHVGTDTIWRLMRRGEVGCRIDGGGRSQRHRDAQVIASVLAILPAEHGGRGMAASIAGHARAGTLPDCMTDAKPRCVPAGWKRGNQYRQDAETAVVGEVVTVHRGRRIRRQLIACPVRYTPTAAQIGAARDEYLRWWGALLWLLGMLAGRLDSIALTDALPPMEPWRKISVDI